MGSDPPLESDDQARRLVPRTVGGAAIDHGLMATAACDIATAPDRRDPLRLQTISTLESGGWVRRSRPRRSSFSLPES